LFDGGDLFASGGVDHGKGVIDVLDVVEADVEVDDVPRFCIEPVVEALEGVGGVGAVFWWAVDVGFVAEEFADGEGVADGDRVAEEEDAREVGDVFDLEEFGAFG
jgi:hypothetical protein